MELGATAKRAAELVGGDRNASYGDPMDDFTRTCGLFYLLTGKSLTAEEGLLFMMCVKLSREANRHSEDNMVDLCGYADLRNYVLSKVAEA